MKAVHMIAFVLLVIGGLNWGLLGVTGGSFNLVWAIFGAWPMLVYIIYVLVGLSAIYEAVMHGKNCKTCSMNKAMPMQAK